MKDSAKDWFFNILTFIGVTIGFWAGHWNARNIERANAIKAGAAEYIVDSKTGETKFVYKNMKE